MLSAESAAGKYPVEAVTMQQFIINKVEVRVRVSFRVRVSST
jgi:pyruvate kinase